jgi:hypothetical protein
MRIDNPQVQGQLELREGSNSELSGSFSGSFQGDGSQLTGVISSSFSDTSISSSFATTASYAENAGGGSGFPFSGSAIITGSLELTGNNTDLVIPQGTNRTSSPKVGSMRFDTSKNTLEVYNGTIWVQFNSSNILGILPLMLQQ